MLCTHSAIMFLFSPFLSLMTYPMLVVSNSQHWSHTDLIHGCNSAPSRVLHLTSLPQGATVSPVWTYQTPPGLLRVIAITERMLLQNWRRSRSADERSAAFTVGLITLNMWEEEHADPIKEVIKSQARLSAGRWLTLWLICHIPQRTLAGCSLTQHDNPLPARTLISSSWPE